METLAFSEKSYLERLAGRIIKYPHPAFEASKTITQSGSSTKVNIVYSMFKDNWYNYNISPKYDSNIINYHAYDYTDIINDAAQSFTATLEWVWLYYSSGTKDINLDWYYAYSFAPLLTDMTSHNFFDGSFREHLVETDNAHAFYHPLQQMMMIFHPRSSNLIPFGLGSLMSSASNLVDMYPTTALITHDGYNTDWQKDILLPPLDPQRIVDAVKPQTLPNIHVRYPYDTQVFDDVADQLKKQRTNVARVTQRQTNTPVTTNPIPSNRGLTSALSGRQSSAMIQPFVRRR
jgi:5'-3' exonuclease